MLFYIVSLIFSICVWYKNHEMAFFTGILHPILALYRHISALEPNGFQADIQ